MTFTVRFSPNAQRDFLRAQDYYDEVAPDQTDRFIAEVFAAARVLAEHVDIGRMMTDEVRRWPLHVFPFQLWYRVNYAAHDVRIVAVVGDAQDHARLTDRLM